MTMDDVAFSRGPARRPVPRVADPLLQWSTGLQTTERRIYAGWLVEVGRNPTLDEAMEQAGFARTTIKHGSGNTVTHWAVETGNMFVVADGVQSISEMQHTTDRFGIAFGWARHPSTGRQQSQIRFRAFLQELLAIGFNEPLLVTVKGTLTGDVIAALTQQYDVLDAVDRFRRETGKQPLHPPFYACSVPLAPGREVSRGTTQTKEITPIVAQIPNPVTKEYVAAHWVKRPWVALIEGLIDQTIAWSATTSTQIAVGEEPANGPAEDEAMPPRAAAPRGVAAQTNGHARRGAEEDLL